MTRDDLEPRQADTSWSAAIPGPVEGTGVDEPADAVRLDEPGDERTRPAREEPDWVRRRRLDAVFGDGAHGQALGDQWYRDQVPPHHG